MTGCVEPERAWELLVQADHDGELDAAEAAAARGDISRAAAEAARQIATDRRVALIALDQSIAEQAVALELAVGAPLESAATGAPAP